MLTQLQLKPPQASLAPGHQVQDAPAVFNFGAALDQEVTAKGLFEAILVIVGKAVVPHGEHQANAWILRRHELDDDRGAATGEKRRDAVEWQVVGDRQVVEKRQREHGVGWPSIEQRGPLGVFPPDPPGSDW